MFDVEDALIAAAGKAFRLTRFYGAVYEAEPADVSEIRTSRSRTITGRPACSTASSTGRR